MDVRNSSWMWETESFCVSDCTPSDQHVFDCRIASGKAHWHPWPALSALLPHPQPSFLSVPPAFHRLLHLFTLFVCFRFCNHPAWALSSFGGDYILSLCNHTCLVKQSQILYEQMCMPSSRGVKSSPKISVSEQCPICIPCIVGFAWFNAWGCVHCMHACMHKRTPLSNDYFVVFASCSDVVSMYFS